MYVPCDVTLHCAGEIFDHPMPSTINWISKSKKSCVVFISVHRPTTQHTALTQGTPPPNTHYIALPHSTYNTQPEHTVHHPTTQYTTLPHSTPPYHTVHRPTTQYTTLPHSTSPYHTVHHPTTQYIARTHSIPPYSPF